MSITVKRLAPPLVGAIGYKVSDAGDTTFWAGLLPSQVTPGGTPESVTSTSPYMFSRCVVIFIIDNSSSSAIYDTDISLLDYDGAPEAGIKTIIGMLPENEVGAGNILFNFGIKTPSPTESEFYYEPLLILRPGEAYPAAFIEGLNHFKTYTQIDDVMTITFAIFAKGQVGQESAVRIKIV